MTITVLGLRGVPDSRHGLNGADRSFETHSRRRLRGNYARVLAHVYLTRQIYKLRASASAAGASVSARPIWPPLWDYLNIIWSLQRAYARAARSSYLKVFCLAAPIDLKGLWVLC
jgi:hypothetical protein